jgi:FSR family fosmidomycin resistance protein-like MFS transporter
MSSLTRSISRSNSSSIALTLVSAAHGLNHAYAVLMPLAYLFVRQDIPLTNTDIGIMTGAGNAASGLLQLAFSYLSLYIARRWLLGAGQIVTGLSTLLTGAANNFRVFFAGNLLARIGGSPQHPVGNSILADRYDEGSRGFALSMHVAGGNVGTVAIPIVGTFVLATIGWRATLFLYAGLVILMGLALIIFVNDAKGAGSNGQGAPPRSGARLREIGRILRDRNIFFILAATTVAAGGRGLGVLTTFIPLYFGALKVDENVIALLVTVMLMGSVIGPIVLGKVSDVRGRREILLLTYAAATLITLVFVSLGRNIAPLFLVLFLLGTTYSESPLLLTFLADSTGSLDRDLALGVYFTVAFGIGSFWTSVLGYVIDSFGFTAGFYVMAASYVGAALLVLPTREARAGLKPPAQKAAARIGQ